MYIIFSINKIESNKNEGGTKEMKIVKRDGHIVDYDPEKIRIAIGKANNEVRGKEKATKEEIKEIIHYIEDLNK